jgi:glycosyltransferase involved in cell wall biosynthesis
MIVDNHVDGDSRVQKMALSAAAAGFDTTLVARSRDAATHHRSLGDATVILVPVPLTLLSHTSRAPGRSLRWPLAYGTKEHDVFRSRSLRAAKSHAAEKAVLVKNRRLAGEQAVLARVGVITRRIWLKVRSAMHVVRHRQFASAVDHRKHERSSFDQSRARFRLRLGGDSAWRRLDPTLVDFDNGFANVVLDLEPELIHAHDFRMVGIAVRAAERLRAAGKECRAVYDAHEFMPGVHARNLSWQLGNMAHESVYARRADAVVTVSDTLARMLQEAHGLPVEPTVVLNAPSTAPVDSVPHGGIREHCGLAATTPLLAYIGSPAPQRGLMTIIEALPLLPDLHAALVLPTGTPHAAPLVERAAELGVTDRFHLLPYVAQDEVVAYIRSADLGAIPIHHHLNHEISLITKYFDYAHARLPIVVSDVETMARTTRELGIGEVFIAEDTEGFAAAVRLVLADKDRYTAAYTPPRLHRWSWEAQADTLTDLYLSLLPADRAAAVTPPAAVTVRAEGA